MQDLSLHCYFAIVLLRSYGYFWLREVSLIEGHGLFFISYGDRGNNFWTLQQGEKNDDFMWRGIP